MSPYHRLLRGRAGPKVNHGLFKVRGTQGRGVFNGNTSSLHVAVRPQVSWVNPKLETLHRRPRLSS